MNYRTKNYYKSILLVPNGIRNSKTVANMSFITNDNKLIIKDYISKETIQIILK